MGGKSKCIGFHCMGNFSKGNSRNYPYRTGMGNSTHTVILLKALKGILITIKITIIPGISVAYPEGVAKVA